MFQFAILLLVFFVVVYYFMVWAKKGQLLEGISGGAEAQLQSHQGPAAFMTGQGDPIPVGAYTTVANTAITDTARQTQQPTSRDQQQHLPHQTNFPYLPRGTESEFTAQQRYPYYSRLDRPLMNTVAPTPQDYHYYYPRATIAAPKPILITPKQLKYRAFWAWLESLLS